MENATPRPWVTYLRGAVGRPGAPSGSRLILADFTFQADADFVVRAVNSFDAMREALIAADGYADFEGGPEGRALRVKIAAALALADK